MSKKTTEQTPTTQEQTQEPTQPKPQSKELEKLLSDGHVTLSAPSREELFKQFDALKYANKGINLSCGAVAQSDDGLFLLQINTIKQ